MRFMGWNESDLLSCSQKMYRRIVERLLEKE